MATMWLSTPNRMVAPPNLAPPDGVRYKVIQFLQYSFLTWIPLYQKNAAKNVDFGHLMRGEGGQQKVTVLFTFENVENVGRSLRQLKYIDIYLK